MLLITAALGEQEGFDHGRCTCFSLQDLVQGNEAFLKRWRQRIDLIVGSRKALRGNRRD